MKKILILLSMIILILFSTATCLGNISSFVDPDFKNVTYQKVMVFIPTDDLNFRTRFEQYFIKSIQKQKRYNGTIISSLDIFPPTRQIEEKQIQSILNENQIDGILQIVLTDSKTTISHTPGYMYLSNNSFIYSSGHEINYANLSCEVKIIDVKTAKTAWMVTINANGRDGFTRITIEKLFKSIIKHVIKKLERDKVLSFRK